MKPGQGRGFRHGGCCIGQSTENEAGFDRFIWLRGRWVGVHTPAVGSRTERSPLNVIPRGPFFVFVHSEGTSQELMHNFSLFLASCFFFGSLLWT
jgi:hypothetical protein